MTSALVRDDFYTVDKREELRKVQGTIDGDRDDIPILEDDGKAFGVLNEKGMISSRIDLNEKLEDYAVGTKLLDPGAGLDEAVQVVLTNGTRWVPVVEDGEALGYVAARDLLVRVLEEDGMGNATAWDLARKAPVLEEETTLGEAIRAFREDAGVVHVLPVVDAHDNISGVLARRKVIQAQEKGERSSRRAISKEFGGEQESRSDWPVEGLADGHFQTVDPGDGAGPIAAAVDDFGFAIVVEGRSPQSVVTGLTGLRALRG